MASLRPRIITISPDYRPRRRQPVNNNLDDSTTDSASPSRARQRSRHERSLSPFDMPEATYRNNHRYDERKERSDRVEEACAQDSTPYRRHRRRRRRSSTSETSRECGNDAERQIVELPIRKASTISLLPKETRRVSADRIKVSRPLRPEALQRVRSRGSTTIKKAAVVTTEEIVDLRSIPESKDVPTRRRTVSTPTRPTRPALVRSATSARQTTKVSPLPTVKEESKRSIPKQRPASVFGSLFGPPRPAPPEEKVSCLTCLDDVPSSKAPKLVCGHHMCYKCLKRIFTMSVSDPAHMPPKCCTEECIPIKHVTKIFDDRFKMRWNRKYQEYTTKNRIYCPAKGCGTWIPPKDISRDREGGRKYGTCKKCKTQVCAACNGKKHKSKECPKDDATREFAEMAKSNGWQRCYNCSATVELKEGCNHMTCRCTAEFCIICGVKWKSCDCPWFNYAAPGAADQLNHFNIPQVREELARGGAAFAQPRAYHEEMERRRIQERRDEELARRMQDIDLEYGVTRDRYGGFGIGNAQDHHLHQDFVQQMPNAGTNDRNDAHRFAVERVAAGLRAQERMVVNPFQFLQPAAPQTAVPPVILPTARRTTTQRRSAAADSELEPPLRRTATQGAVIPAELKEESEQESTSSERRRSAVLAGLTRISDNGRVDAWRRYVSGEPVVSPL